MRYRLLLIALLLCLPTSALAVISHSGTIAHGESVTLYDTTNSFGTKTTAAPEVWDDCSGTNPLTLWDGAWPEIAQQPSSGIRYATSGTIAGIAVPHSNVTKYLVGRAYDQYSNEQGHPWDVLVYKSEASAPSYVYASWYMRVGADYYSGDNFKWFNYSGDTSPYYSGGYWYLEYVTGLGNTIHIKDDFAGLSDNYIECGSYGRDYLCNSHYLASSTNPNAQWVKMEVYIKVTDQNDGFVDLYEDGVLQINTDGGNGTGTHSYNGPTDATISPSNARNIAIGGFTRELDTDNWRFFNDLYLDYSFAHVILGNNATYANCTVKEVQIPTAWAAGEIKIDINQGTFSTNDPAYIHVIDSSGTPLTSYEVTIGTTATNPTVVVNNSGQTVTTTPLSSITGTATATTGRTISSVTSPGLTVDCDDGTWDELSETFTVVSNITLSEGLNTKTFTATDSSSDTGTADFTVTYTPEQQQGNCSDMSGGGEYR